MNAPTSGPRPGDLTQRLRETSQWADEMVAEAGIPISDVPMVTAGGGFGSFVLADHLRVAGMPKSHLRAVTPLPAPYHQYRHLAACSQIPDDSRLRSDSASCPDNLWGFPSYALREAWERKSLGPIFGVATEPVLTDYFTPRAEQVYRTTEKEARRIGWGEMTVAGRVRMVRKRRGGGYFVLVTPPPGSSPTARIALRARWVHLSVGYPGVNFLPDLQDYRQATGDFRRVVNAYEPHDHVYGTLVRGGGTVLLRGSGIVGSRILQRLLDDVEHRGARTRIVHLFRTYRDGPSGPLTFRRESANGFSYQAFNYPKAAWGGTLREKLEHLDGQQRIDLISAMGGTNTPHRKHWDQQLERARAAGVYSPAVGVVQSVESSGPQGVVTTTIKTGDGQLAQIPADYIIDATGLESDLSSSQLLADLLQHAGAGRNPLRRLDVSGSFEISGTRSGDGRMYASGSITLGGPYAPVDSFLGLQYAALQIIDELAAQGFIAKLGSFRSVSQWLRWARGVAP